MAISFDDAKERFKYDPETGTLVWRHGQRCAGREAGNRHFSYRSGRPQRIEVEVRGRPYGAHQIAWLIHYGTWPESMIDHKDGDPFNNRIDNLRLCTNAENKANCRISRNKKSCGVKGVYWHNQAKKWSSYIGSGGKLRYLGLFDNVDAAKAAYDAAAKQQFGAFARAG